MISGSEGNTRAKEREKEKTFFCVNFLLARNGSALSHICYKLQVYYYDARYLKFDDNGFSNEFVTNYKAFFVTDA